jgi:CobQ-like glutamine amidotransferase family enzyme
VTAQSLSSAGASREPVRIVSIYPTLLGTYGDGGNVAALAHIAALHGLTVDVATIDPGMLIPDDADIYVMGGGEDTAQVAAANALRASGALTRAVGNGASVLAICAGYQLLGHEFPDANGNASPGLGLLDVYTDRLPKRAVGELAAEPIAAGIETLTQTLTGYENHGGATHLGVGVTPLALVSSGVGNGDGTEGAITGRVIGTYLHGPALVRNPRLAETLLGWAVGERLDPIVEHAVEELRRERLGLPL